MQRSDLLKDFWVFVKDYRGLPSWIAKAALAGPVVNLATGFGPPGMSTGAVSLLTAVVEIATLMLSYQLLGTRIKTISKKKLENILSFTTLGVFGILIVYLCTFQFFSFHNPESGRREAKGLWKQAELRDALGKAPPSPVIGDVNMINQFNSNTSDQTWLDAVGYEANRIWEEWSIHVVEVALILSWLTFFGFLAGSSSTFIVLRRQERIRVTARKMRRKPRATQQEASKEDTNN